MSKFKAGDLAVIVGAHFSTENIGKVVILVEFLAANEVHEVECMGFRHRAPHDGWLVEGENVVSRFGDEGVCIILEKHLMPLKGDFQPEQQKAKEEEPCN